MINHLNSGRVKENTDTLTEGLWWDVVGELGTNNTAVTVSTGDLTPHNTSVRSLDGSLGLVDVSYTLTGVEVSIGSGLATFNLNEGGVFTDVALGTTEAENAALSVCSIYVAKLRKIVDCSFIGTVRCEIGSIWGLN